MQKALSERGVQRFVGRAEVAEALDISMKTLARRVADGKFPPPVRLSPNRVGWAVETVRCHLQSLVDGVTKRAVADPDKLAPDEIAPTMRELGARLVSEHIGEPISADQIRLKIDRQAPGSEIDFRRAELLEQVEKLCGHFTYDRAMLVAASLFPAIRQHLEGLGVNYAQDPDVLRTVAVRCLDDAEWADLEEALKASTNDTPEIAHKA